MMHKNAIIRKKIDDDKFNRINSRRHLFDKCAIDHGWMYMFVTLDYFLS